MALEPQLIKLELKGDERGSLIALEALRNVPFGIKRAYFIFGTLPGVRRGKHAHRRLRQLAVCVHGSCKIALDDGRSQATVELKAPDVALYLPPMLWHEMYDFSAGCVLLVLAEDYYQESDYIRSYEQFLLSVRK